MKKHVKTLLLAVGLLCNVFCVTYVRAADDYYVVAYVTSWSQGLPDPSRMTHINYAFGHVGKDFRSVTIDNTSRLQQIVALKNEIQSSMYSCPSVDGARVASVKWRATKSFA